MDSITPLSSLHGRRSASRSMIASTVGFRRCKESRYDTPLADLSVRGCRIAPVQAVSPGERVWVTLPGLASLEARIRWSNRWIAGAEFEHPIHPAVFANLVQRLS